MRESGFDGGSPEWRSPERVPETTARDLGKVALSQQERPHGSYESDGIADEDKAALSIADDGVDETVLHKRDQGRARIAEDEESYLLGGDAAERVDDWLPQGRNDVNVKTTCAIACAAELGRRMGNPRTEDQLLHTVAENGWWKPDRGGGIDSKAEKELLATMGLHGDVRKSQGLEDLAAAVEEGHGVIAHVNGRLVYDRSRSPSDAPGDVVIGPDQRAVNHAITVTGTIRDPGTHELVAFHFNNPTEQPGRRIDTATMAMAWELRGGSMLVVERK
jgi:hypothetical protein